MTDHIDKLIGLSQVIWGRPPDRGKFDATFALHDVSRAFFEMLCSGNGFVAFESALTVFPFGDADSEVELTAWNDRRGWMSGYSAIDSQDIFFGQDVFGNQFVLNAQGIRTFDPETGEFEALSASLKEWAGLILDDYDYMTGYPVAHAWQSKHGKLNLGEVLCPKIPFVLGGEYHIDNLFVTSATRSMRLRSDLAKQLANAPDGTSVRIVLNE